MCYEYSFRKKAVKELLENRRQEASFRTKINAWVREAKSALTAGETGTPARSRHRKDEKVTG